MPVPMPTPTISFELCFTLDYYITIRYLIMVSWHKGKMAGSEPLIQEADPHITKLDWSSGVG